jgi:hypothetical protein
MSGYLNLVWVMFSVTCVAGLGKFFVELVTEVIGLLTAGLLGIPIVGLVLVWRDS